MFVANFVQSLIFGIGIGTRGVFGTSVSAHLREKPVKFADSKWLQSFRRAVEPATSTTVAAEWLAPSDQQKIGGERVRRTPSVALQQRCPLLMTARSRACDAAPRWPKRSLCACGTLRPALTLPGSQIAAESAYWCLGVNFDMRKSMSSSTP